MSASDPVAPEPYDDAVVRTRQSWQRTALGAAAVALLLVRELIVDDAPRWLALVAVLPAATVLAVSVFRGRGLVASLRQGEAATAFSPYAATVAIVTVAAVGLALAFV